MHSLKTSLTISPVKRAYRHKLSNCGLTGNYPETGLEEINCDFLEADFGTNIGR